MGKIDAYHIAHITMPREPLACSEFLQRNKLSLVKQTNYITGKRNRKIYTKGKPISISVTVEDKTQNPISGTYVSEEGDVCWLCPAQMKFFGKVANTIFVKF